MHLTFILKWFILGIFVSDVDDLNILLLNLESIGKLTWLRHAPHVHEYIVKDLGGVLLEKHSKVGMNTCEYKQLWIFQNLKTREIPRNLQIKKPMNIPHRNVSLWNDLSSLSPKWLKSLSQFD